MSVAPQQLEHCCRCGDPVVYETPGGFHVEAVDRAADQGGRVDGRLCPRCWDELLAFLRDVGAQRLVRAEGDDGRGD